MPPKRKLVTFGADSPTTSKVKKPATVKVTRKVAKPPVNLNHKWGHYPWDDHQDDIIVRSIEKLRRVGVQQVAGAEHYAIILDRRKEEYEHICTHPDEYRKRPDVPKLEDDIIAEETLVEDSEEEEYDFDRPPQPPNRVDDYTSRIYTTRISNPAVFLAIIRIAQVNLRCLDFLSAVNHIPNLPFHTSLPKLSTEAFAEDVEHKKNGSRYGLNPELNFAFLPDFYSDGRHALGYYHLSPTATIHNPHNPPQLQTCLFTPCTTADLENYGLVGWLEGTKTAHVDNMAVVGGREGEWLHTDAVEEWEARKMVLRVVGRGWQRRLLAYFGKEASEN